MDDRFKFRAWDKVNNKWAHDELRELALEFGDNRLADEDMEDIALSSSGELYLIDECGEYAYLPAERFDVQFSTGLKDKNGKLIYEGDIVYAYANKSNYEVRHGAYLNDENCDECYGWYIRRIVEYSVIRSGEPMNDSDEYLEIIGNVYEHPELIDNQAGTDRQSDGGE